MISVRDAFLRFVLSCFIKHYFCFILKMATWAPNIARRRSGVPEYNIVWHWCFNYVCSTLFRFYRFLWDTENETTDKRPRLRIRMCGNILPNRILFCGRMGWRPDHPFWYVCPCLVVHHQRLNAVVSSHIGTNKSIYVCISNSTRNSYFPNGGATKKGGLSPRPRQRKFL